MQNMTKYALEGKALETHVQMLVRTADFRCPTTRSRELARIANTRPTITHVWVSDTNPDIYEEV